MGPERKVHKDYGIISTVNKRSFTAACSTFGNAAEIFLLVVPFGNRWTNYDLGVALKKTSLFGKNTFWQRRQPCSSRLPVVENKTKQNKPTPLIQYTSARSLPLITCAVILISSCAMCIRINILAVSDLSLNSYEAQERL